jgi:low affinity Fe/Cu permease
MTLTPVLVKLELQEEPLSADRHRIHHQASHAVSNLTTFLGSFTAICGAMTLVALWAFGLLFVQGGPFNSHYEMVITSITTMITFVMVFIIQSTQNRESRAIQTKLDALLIAKHGLDEAGLLGLEDKPDAAIKDVQSEVHDSERRSSEERNRIVISANVGVRPSEHQSED